MQLVAGTNFTPAAFTNTDMQEKLETNDIGRQVILNEEAVKALGYTVNNGGSTLLSPRSGGRIWMRRYSMPGKSGGRSMRTLRSTVLF
ncbi:MAG TPA: hypothetical protein VHW43_05040 [Puia sp.]|nr:hypothetical protein [Puia sp.]